MTMARPGSVRDLGIFPVEKQSADELWEDDILKTENF